MPDDRELAQILIQALRRIEADAERALHKAAISTGRLETFGMRLGVVGQFDLLRTVACENHVHALSIYFMHYNFARIHSAHRMSPAMAVNVSDKLWSMEDIVRMVDEWEAAQKAA